MALTGSLSSCDSQMIINMINMINMIKARWPHCRGLAIPCSG
jgi:hypothetical protein